jgi:hypothetical protein
MTRENLADFRNRHQGATMIVCGCGTSLKLLERPERFVTIGVNDVGRLFTPDYLVVLNDPRQFNGDRYDYVAQTKAKAVFTQLDLPLERVVRFRLGQRGGTDRADPSCLNYTNNSTYAAVDLARHLGARRIGLLGVDFTDDHFYKATGKHPLAGQLLQIDREYAGLAAACHADGVELVNLSPTSRLKSLPRASLHAWAEEAAHRGAPRVFVVNYRFLSAGTIFDTGLQEAAATLGVQSEHADWDDAQLAVKVERFQPDLLFVVHGRRFVQRWSQRFAAWRSAVWLVDEPYEVDDTAAWSDRFDLVFVNDPATLARHRNARELPAAYAPSLHRPLRDHRPTYRVGFIGGTNPRREQLLSSLADRGLLDYVVGGPWSEPRLRSLCLSANIPPERTAALYQDTAIVINVFRERHHYNRAGLTATALNPRICEALASGALVLSEPREALAQQVPELPTFRDAAEAGDLIEHFLSDQADRLRVWRAAADRLADATYANRLKTVLHIALNHSVEPVMPQRLAQASGRACEGETPDPSTTPSTERTPTPTRQWIDCGDAAVAEDDETVIAGQDNDKHPGSERGVTNEAEFGDVVRGAEDHVSADAVLLAEIHQQDRMDQATISYHLFSEPDRSYLAMQDLQMRDAVRELDVVRTFDDEWDDLGGIVVRDGAGNIIIAPAPSVAPGAERGLVGRSPHAFIDLECEVLITGQAVFLAKIHQQDRLDQTTNSYHVLCGPRRAYVARHNHIFGHIPLARENWQKVRLSFVSGQIAVHVGGTLIHRFEDRMLDAGYPFLGAKGGTVRLRDIRLSAPGHAAGADQRASKVVDSRLMGERASLLPKLAWRVGCDGDQGNPRRAGNDVGAKHVRNFNTENGRSL